MIRRRRSIGWLVPLILLSAAGASEAVAATEGTLDQRELALLGEPAGQSLSGAELAAATEKVTSMMRCPACQGLSVADSHTPAAQAMRAKAEALVAAGYSRNQVLGYFEASYGEFIRLAPRAEGFNLVVWFLPGLGLLVGVLVIWRRLRGRQVAAPVVETEDAELAAYRERVRREVGR